MRKIKGSLRQTNTALRAENVRREQFRDTEPTGQELPELLHRTELESYSEPPTSEEERKSLRRTVTMRRQAPSSSLRNTNSRLTASTIRQLTSPTLEQEAIPESELPLRRPRPTWGAKRAVPPATSTLSVAEIQNYLDQHRNTAEDVDASSETASDNTHEK